MLGICNEEEAMNVNTSITIPVPVFQHWREYQKRQEPMPALSPLLAELLERYLKERDGAVPPR
jgi:hypothetical protein